MTAYTYVTSDVEIDADGAPNAYHPNDTGLDALANAGFPHGGWPSVLVTDPENNGRPFVQRTGPFAGFFVSKTSLEDPNAPTTEPRRYVDATAFPYIVFPGAFEQLEGTGVLGDIVLAKHIQRGLTSSALVADIGPTNAPLGEISIWTCPEKVESSSEGKRSISWASRSDGSGRNLKPKPFGWLR
jgi:hypothetical protein